MKIQRQISWYNRNTGDLTGEINVDHIPLTSLKKLFVPLPKDPLLYNPYEIRHYQAKRLASLVRLDFDLATFSYYLECFQN